jgi:GTP-binding protein LepA
LRMCWRLWSSASRRPRAMTTRRLQALVFDAVYDNYRGAICFVRVVNGTLKPGMRMRMMQTEAEFDVVEWAC